MSHAAWFHLYESLKGKVEVMEISESQGLGGAMGVTVRGQCEESLSDGAVPSLDCGGGYMKAT